MTNTNCLEGIRCPKCGFEDSFSILVSGFADITDNGVDEFYGVGWAPDAYIRCHECGLEATVEDFTTPEEAQ